MKISHLILIITFSFFLFSSNTLFSKNNPAIDSLLNELKYQEADTLRLKTYFKLCELCNTHDNLRYAEPALQIINKVLSQTNNPDVKRDMLVRKSALYKYFRVYYFELGDSSKFPLQYCKSLLSDYQSVHDTIGIVTTKLNISQYYAFRFDARNAIDFCQEALQLAQQIKYKHGIAKCLTTMAQFYQNQGDIQQAFVNIDQALQLYTEVKDTAKICDVLKMKGGLYSESKNVDQAVRCFEKTIALNQAGGHKDELRNSYNQLGLIYSDNHDLPNALKNYLIALEYAKNLPDKTWMRGILGNIGDIYRRQGHVKQAIRFHEMAFNAIRPLHLETQEAWVNWQFAMDYIQLKDYRKAMLYNNRFLDVMKRLGMKDRICDAEELAAKIDSSRGNFKDAYLHYQQYICWRDQLNSEEIRRQAVKEKFQHELDEDKKLQAIAQSRKDNESRQQIQKQKIIRNAFIAGSVLLILLIVLLINRSNLKRSIEIEKMRSRLSRDLHDDIGSTLSSINILSRMAQRNASISGDEKSTQTLEKINERSQRLLSSMSDIIWNINPANDSLEEVISRMREYATTILEANQIEYNIQFPSHEIRQNMSMEIKNNLYLIFKEAVNNLVKYSGATYSSFYLLFEDKQNRMIIEDNGRGFDKATLTHLGGLNNMEHRAKEINGTLNITSVVGKGTKVELIFPRFN